DLLEAATHEIGHALGLAHEPPPSQGGENAIMNPYYGGRFHGLHTGFLYPSDVHAIDALYGAGQGSVTPLHLTPVFSVAGSTLYAHGGAGNDPIVFAAGATASVVLVNSARFTIDPTKISSIVMDGGGGSDTAYLSDYQGGTLFGLRPGGGTLVGRGW